jgi:hypothetical protein
VGLGLRDQLPVQPVDLHDVVILDFGQLLGQQLEFDVEVVLKLELAVEAQVAERELSLHLVLKQVRRQIDQLYLHVLQLLRAQLRQLRVCLVRHVLIQQMKATLLF